MKKKFLTIVVLIISLFTLQVDAKQFYANEKVKVSEQQDNSIFAAGVELDISSFIDGAVFAAGEEINISSSQDIMFIAGEEINIEDAYTKDAFLAGTDIEIKNSQIRDLYAAGEEIEINSPISNNAYLAGEKVVINSEIMGNVSIAAAEIIIKDNAKINGTLEYPEDAYVNISKEAVINKTKEYKQTKEAVAVTIATQIEEFIVSYLGVLLTGILLMYLFKKQFDKLEKEELTFKNVMSKAGLGFLVLVASPIAVCLLMCTVIGVPLSFIALALYIILIYTSIIPSGYFFAYKLLKDKVKNEYALLAIGILGIKLLEYVPFIGGFVMLISLCFGLWIPLSINKKKTTKEK